MDGQQGFQIRIIQIGVLICIILLIIIGILAVALVRASIKRKRKQNRKIEKKQRDNTIEAQLIKDFKEKEIIETTFPEKETTEMEEVRKTEKIIQEDGKKDTEVVVDVQDVSMHFKLSTSNVSGFKEYLIQKITKKLSYREFQALEHISFQIHKGEVIGIIGTNGSGKSTILKIISGALIPTSGHVEVDKSKIQLLTLGTGFDMELTGRENVYLNGAIIGYSKEFIDEHYEDIVTFSELGEFMEEKVKNYSSGMVSRLGFAIATTGNAAEILILDEVLSVGDEFFKKKSLARIKEMIHGGSTVIMVSHNMNTIMEHCTRAIWIEKGVLKMVGKAKEVCKEYKNSTQVK